MHCNYFFLSTGDRLYVDLFQKSDRTSKIYMKNLFLTINENLSNLLVKIIFDLCNIQS